MESFCIRQTALPHISRLFADYTYDFDRVSRFYRWNPAEPVSYANAAAALDFPQASREALADALRQQNGDALGVEKLSRPGTVAVVTGQQVGLFSGPEYTVYKALTAAKLASRLEESGIPAVPVFWLATEDHDFAEVNHSWVFDSAHNPHRIELALPAGTASGQPVGGLRFDAYPLKALRDALGDLPFAAETCALVEDAYRPGREFGAAFTALLRPLLAPYGFVFFDPMHPSSRRLAAPLLRRAVEAGPELNRLVLERNRELEAAGYHAQVHVEKETSFFFLLDGGRRVAVRRIDGDYSANGRRFTAAELSAQAENLSPNALLRPVVQDSMLPAVAYVGGPAELAYLAQSEVLYRELLGRMPVAVHRHSATLLDARAAKLTRRYRLELTDFFKGEQSLCERLAAELVPPALASLLEQKRAQAQGLLDEMGASLGGFDASLLAAFETSRRKILYQLGKIERKVGREALRRDERAQREAAYLNGLIYPEKHLQERFYSILPFLAKHGLDLVGRLYDGIELNCPDHRVMTIT
jgi:bacillithiol synthase